MKSAKKEKEQNQQENVLINLQKLSICNRSKPNIKLCCKNVFCFV